MTGISVKTNSITCHVKHKVNVVYNTLFNLSFLYSKYLTSLCDISANVSKADSKFAFVFVVNINRDEIKRYRLFNLITFNSYRQV